MTVSSHQTLESTAWEFLAAIERQDFNHLEHLLEPNVRFRVLVPAKLREADEPRGAVDNFRRWFAGADHLEVMAKEVDSTADRVRFRYLIKIHDDDGWAVIDQSGYLAGAERIESLDIVCSGFRPL